MKITLPDEQTVLMRLKSVLDMGSDFERFYADFARRVASKEMVEQGVYLCWQLCLATYAKDPYGVPHFGGMVMYDFDRYMEALFPDNPDFVSAIMAWHKSVVS